MGQIKLVLDNNVLAEYNEYYFSMHPRAKKVPIEKPWYPSLNQIIVMPRMSENHIKQVWKTFIAWWIKQQGYQDMKLSHFKLCVRIFKNSRIRADNDNMTPKLPDDGFTEAGFIVDDDYKHMYSLTIEVGYDPVYPRTEFIFEYDDKLG